MDVSNKVASVLDAIKHDLVATTGGEATLVVSGEENTGRLGDPVATVVVELSDGSRFGMYSTGSTASLLAFLRGFNQALSLINGNYALKPLNDAAARRRRDSLCPWKEEARRYRIMKVVGVGDNAQTTASEITLSLDQYYKAKDAQTMKAASSPRFALHRNKYRRED